MRHSGPWIERESAKRLTLLGGGSEPNWSSHPGVAPRRHDLGRYLCLGRSPAHDDARLQNFLETGQVVIHPFIVGELALGNLRQRKYHAFCVAGFASAPYPPATRRFLISLPAMRWRDWASAGLMPIFFRLRAINFRLSLDPR